MPRAGLCRVPWLFTKSGGILPAAKWGRPSGGPPGEASWRSGEVRSATMSASAFVVAGPSGFGDFTERCSPSRQREPRTFCLNSSANSSEIHAPRWIISSRIATASCPESRAASVAYSSTLRPPWTGRPNSSAACRLSVVGHKDRIVKMGHGKRTEFAEAQSRFAAAHAAEEGPLFGAGRGNRLRCGDLNVSLRQVLLNEIRHEERAPEKFIEKRKPAGKVEIDDDTRIDRHRACGKPMQAILPFATPAPAYERRRRSGSSVPRASRARPCRRGPLCVRDD